MEDLVNISIPTAGGTALLGYLVVFFGLVLLMCVLLIMGAINTRKQKKAQEADAIPVPDRSAPVLEVIDTRPKAKGTAGELKLYDTDPKDAAMIMAIVADALGKPLNELRFISIREVK
ncbi:MAG: OadG family protein [Oscillospiraceae bacterium]|nr:OadG family protein [Oscillospiraceae bacterium]